jgi:hypothetical protein
MNSTLERLRPAAIVVRTLVVKFAVPALVLAVALIVFSAPASAQACGAGTGHACTGTNTPPCGYGTGHSCNAPDPPDPPDPSVPEPSTLLQLGIGIVVLTFVGRKHLFAKMRDNTPRLLS